MKRKKVCKRKIICLVLMFMLVFTMSTSAAEETIFLPEGQSVSKSVGTPDPRSVLVASRVASIANNEDGTLSVYGQLITHKTLDYASITLYLDRFDPDADDWENISYKDAEFTIEEHGELFMGTPTASYTLSGADIKAGYYYRIRASFIAKKDGRRETAYTETDGVLLTDIK